MGNTCGCVDQAEKDGEVKVENNKLKGNGTVNNQRQQQINNYRDSTLSKNQYQGQNFDQTAGAGANMLFATDDPYLLEL